MTESVKENVTPETETPPPVPSKKELTAEERIQLEQKKKAFEEFKRGALLLKYILQDIEKQKRQQYNRTQRRRFEKELNKGYISKELFDHYSAQIDVISEWIDNQLAPKQAPVDGTIQQTGATITPIENNETKTEV